MATASNEANLEALMIAGYIKTLRKVRKRVKGVRTSHIAPVHLLSKFPNGARGCELAKVEGATLQDIYMRYLFVIRDGLAKKVNKRYYLTDKGQALANAITEEFKPQLKEIIKLLVEMMRE